MTINDAYAQAVLADGPVGYWRLNELSLGEQVADESGHDRHGRFVGRPALGEQGAILASSNCSMTFTPPAHIEIPHSPSFSIPTSGVGLSVEVWMRPDVMQFHGEARNRRYIHWLGKGDRGRMEWGFRFYSIDDPERPNRVSAYAWNLKGGLGAGAYYQGDQVKQGAWLHLVACFDPVGRGSGVSLYVNGERTKGPPCAGTLYQHPEGKWSVIPRSGNAPLRLATRSATDKSFLQGGLDEVAIYPKVLSPDQIWQHYALASVSDKGKTNS